MLPPETVILSALDSIEMSAIAHNASNVYPSGRGIDTTAYSDVVSSLCEMGVCWKDLEVRLSLPYIVLFGRHPDLHNSGTDST